MGNALMAKMKEPSTWKGIGWGLVALGLVPLGSVELLVSVGVGLVGLVEVVRSEAGK